MESKKSTLRETENKTEPSDLESNESITEAISILVPPQSESNESKTEAISILVPPQSESNESKTEAISILVPPQTEEEILPKRYGAQPLPKSSASKSKKSLRASKKARNSQLEEGISPSFPAPPRGPPISASAPVPLAPPPKRGVTLEDQWGLPSGNLSAIKPDDLLKGASRLRKVRQSNFDTVTLGYDALFEGFEDVLGKDHYPIIHCRYALQASQSLNNIVSLDFSGIDQLTDAFFRIMSEENWVMPMLTRLNCAGCIHLTDNAVLWISQTFQKLTDVNFSGCRKITETSLGILCHKYKNLILSARFSSTSVSVVPYAWVDENLRGLKLDGCPLVSPSPRAFREEGLEYLKDRKNMFKMNIYKVVIVSMEELPFSVGQYLVHQKQIQMTRSVWAQDEWSPYSDQSHRFNLFEVRSNETFLDLFLSQGSLCLIPFLLTSAANDMDTTVAKLSKITLSCLTQVSTVVLIGLTETADSANKDLLKRVSIAVDDKLHMAADTLSEAVDGSINKKWKIAGWDFKMQQEFGNLSSWSYHMIQQMVDSSLLVVGTKTSPNPVNEQLDFLKLAFEKMHRFWHPWHDEYVNQLKKEIEIIRELKSTPSGIISSTNEPKSQLAGQSWVKWLELCHVKGLLLFFKNVHGRPVISNYEKFCAMINALMQPKVKAGDRLRCLSPDVPVWLPDDLVKVTEIMGSESAKMLSFLEKRKILIRLPCDHRVKTSDERFVYILYDLLPAEPHINLGHVWRGDIDNEKEQQADRIYCFHHGCPPSLMSTFIKYCSKVCCFTLLWKHGMFIQQGPVDILIELHETRGMPVITLCVRTMKTSNIAGKKHLFNYSMWNALNMFAAILDYTILKFDISVKVEIPCPDCEPTRNRLRIINDEGVGTIEYNVMKSGWDRSLRCKGYCNAKLQDSFIGRRFTSAEMLGPLELTNLAPCHDFAYIQQMKNLSMEYSRCIQCSNCIQYGMKCFSNTIPGKTSRHCGCDTKMRLCIYCGICVRCAGFLAKVENTLDPGHSSSEALVANEANTNSYIKRGNLYNIQKTPVKFYTGFHTMSPEQMNCFEVTIVRGNNFNVGIFMKINDPLISYHVAKGIIYYDVSKLENYPSHRQWRCKEGDRISIRVSYAVITTHRGQHKDLSQYEVTVFKNDVELLAFNAPPSVPLTPYVGVIDPASVIITISGLQTAKRAGKYSLYKPNPVNFYGNMCLEMESTPENDGGKLADDQSKSKEFHLVKVIGVNHDSQTLKLQKIIDDFGKHDAKIQKAEEIECSQKSDQLHPFGHSETYNAIIDDKNDSVQPKRLNLEKAFNRESPITTAPLWLFSQAQKANIPPSPVWSSLRCRDLLLSSAVLLSETVMASDQMKRILYERGLVNFHAGAHVLLPPLSESLDVLYPCRQMLMDSSSLLLHQLCVVRGNYWTLHRVSPTRPLQSKNEALWDIHLVTGKKTIITTEQLNAAAKLLFLFHCMMALKSKVDIPVNHLFWSERPSGCNKEQVESAVGLLLNLMSWKLMAVTDQPLKEILASYEDADALQTTIDILAGPLEENRSDLMKKPVMREEVCLCPGHMASNLTVTMETFPGADFGSYTSFVKSLRIDSKHTLPALPDDFFTQFINLVELFIPNNKLTELPPGVGNCTNLRVLDVDDNFLTDLPDDIVNLVDSLEELTISRNLMTQIPAKCFKLKNLRVLRFEYMLLPDMPEEIGHLENLEAVHGNGNCFTFLPSSFSSLKNLKILRLSGVPWFEIKAGGFLSIDKLDEKFKRNKSLQSWLDNHPKHKEELYEYFKRGESSTLDEKEASQLNAFFFYLFPRFGQWIQPITDEEESGFPMEICELENLEVLEMDSQGLLQIPDEIATLKRLTQVSVNNNPFLTSLSAGLGLCPLKVLDTKHCPSLRTPPIEIRRQGFYATVAYLKRLLTGSVECKRTKLLFVGLGGAGKTSLMRALLSGNDKCYIPSGEAITDGIDITEWVVYHEGENVTYSMWDFAGQTVYYNTHQFFLSNRAVYLLLWNTRLGHEHAGLDFWLSSISVHAPKAPIFVVGTHLDQVSKVELPTEEMSRRYPQIMGYHFISTHTGLNIAALKEQLLEVTLTQQYMGERIPQVWLTFEKAIIGKRSEHSVMSYSDVATMAIESGVYAGVETQQAIQFLHELGSLQHFDNEFLRHHVVIDPQWIVDVMSCIVSVKDSPIKDGCFKHKDIVKVWEDYPANLHTWLLRLTEEFDLTFPLYDQPINLVPCLLPEIQPQFEWPEVDRNSSVRETKMIYKFAYLPAGLFNRGQVRLYQYSDSSVIWKRGSVLRKNKQLCLLLQTKNSELIVKAQGTRPENLLFMVHEVFETLIAESFQGVQYDYLLPCPDCLLSHSRDPFMFPASIIRRATELKAPFLQCTHSFHTVALTDLHTVMPPDNNLDYDVQLINAVRGLRNLRKDLASDVFLSCCLKDLDDSRVKAGQKVNPTQIMADISSRGYKCWFGRNSEDGNMEEAAVAMRDAKVVVILMSSAYANDEQCCNLFKYARLTLKKPIIVVVVDADQNWKKSGIGIFMTDEVYVNMAQAERYSTKVKELTQVLEQRMGTGKQKPTDYPSCFISYAWVNSHQAVALGTRKIDGALGYGDPRGIKDFLQSNDVPCWIDVERVGRKGLFDDIAEGLQHAKVAVACISDEYASSPNCVMEFQFATSSLRIPTVLAVVGTGSKWRASKVGMLSVSYPLISFQEKSDSAYDKLLQLVREKIPAEERTETKAICKETKTAEETVNLQQKNLSFQELYELAQRKFLRQLSKYAEADDLYPRLILVDFIEEETGDMDGGENEKKDEDTQGDKTRPSLKRRATSGHVSLIDSIVKQKSVGFLILCEHEQGWHKCSSPLEAPKDLTDRILLSFTPYLARILALVKNSNQIDLNCFHGEEGDLFFQHLQESTTTQESDFSSVYLELRQEVMKMDTSRCKGNLERCYLPSGKIQWLCKDHQQSSRVTVLSSDLVSPSHHPADTDKESMLLAALRLHEELEFVKILPWTSVWDQVIKKKTAATKPKPKKKLSMRRESSVATGEAKKAKTDSPVTSTQETENHGSTSVESPSKLRSKFKAAGVAAAVAGNMTRTRSQACVLL